MSDFYKMDPAIWNDRTSRLTLEEEAAYLRIVNAIHITKGPIENVDRVMAGLFRCSPRKARSLVAALVKAGKITIENGRISNERAISDLVHRGFVSISRAESGAKGGRTRAENAAKALKYNNTPQANASSREEKSREEIYGGGGSSACVREAVAPTPPPDPPPPPDHPTLRERILEACGADPTSGLTGRGGQQLGRREHMAEVDRWLALPGIGEAEVVSVVREMMAGKRDGPPTTFRYFTPGIERLSAALTAPQIAPRPSAATGTRNRAPASDRIAFDLAHREYTRRLAAGEIRRGPDPADPWAS